MMTSSPQEPLFAALGEDRRMHRLDAEAVLGDAGQLVAGMTRQSRSRPIVLSKQPPTGADKLSPKS
jgi:hypothetical protein